MTDSRTSSGRTCVSGINGGRKCIICDQRWPHMYVGCQRLPHMSGINLGHRCKRCLHMCWGSTVHACMLGSTLAAHVCQGSTMAANVF